MKDVMRSSELSGTDRLKARAEAPVLAIHIHPIMALKARLPKLNALKSGGAMKGVKLPGLKLPKV